MKQERGWQPLQPCQRKFISIVIRTVSSYPVTISHFLVTDSLQCVYIGFPLSGVRTGFYFPVPERVEISKAVEADLGNWQGQDYKNFMLKAKENVYRYEVKPYGKFT